MKPIENLVKKLRYKANQQTHNKILTNILQTFEQQQPTPRPHTLKIIFKSKLTKLTAAVVIAAICFFLTHTGGNGKIQKPEIAQAAVSPAELTNFASLTFAYRQNGMEAVEEMCDKAITLVGPRPAKISITELLEEFNNNNLERTKL